MDQDRVVEVVKIRSAIDSGVIGTSMSATKYLRFLFEDSSLSCCSIKLAWHSPQAQLSFVKLHLLGDSSGIHGQTIFLDLHLGFGFLLALVFL